MVTVTCSIKQNNNIYTTNILNNILNICKIHQIKDTNLFIEKIKTHIEHDNQENEDMTAYDICHILSEDENEETLNIRNTKQFERNLERFTKGNINQNAELGIRNEHQDFKTCDCMLDLHQQNKNNVRIQFQKNVANVYPIHLQECIHDTSSDELEEENEEDLLIQEIRVRNDIKIYQYTTPTDINELLYETHIVTFRKITDIIKAVLPEHTVNELELIIVKDIEANIIKTQKDIREILKKKYNKSDTEFMITNKLFKRSDEYKKFISTITSEALNNDNRNNKEMILESIRDTIKQNHTMKIYTTSYDITNQVFLKTDDPNISSSDSDTGKKHASGISGSKPRQRKTKQQARKSVGKPSDNTESDDESNIQVTNSIAEPKMSIVTPDVKRMDSISTAIDSTSTITIEPDNNITIRHIDHQIQNSSQFETEKVTDSNQLKRTQNVPEIYNYYPNKTEFPKL